MLIRPSAFGELYEQHPLGIPPRIAYYIWFKLNVLADEWTMASEGDDAFIELLHEMLPPVARRHRNPVFTERLASATKRLRDRHCVVPGRCCGDLHGRRVRDHHGS